jgi:hypothetical protein
MGIEIVGEYAARHHWREVSVVFYILLVVSRFSRIGLINRHITYYPFINPTQPILIRKARVLHTNPINIKKNLWFTL